MKRIVLLATVDNLMGLSRENKIPWRIEEIDEFSKNLIVNNIVVISRRYWLSHGRVKGCINFVMNMNSQGLGDFSGGIQELKELMNRNKKKDVFVLGGKEIFKFFTEMADEIIITKLQMNYACDEFFPSIGENFEIVKCFVSLFSIEENCFYSRIHYKHNGGTIHPEYSYLDTLEAVKEDFENGGSGVLYNKTIKFTNLYDNAGGKFPIMTTNRVEYEKIFSKVFLALNGNGEIGFQWRFFGAKHSILFEIETLLNKKEVLGGIDQLEILDERIKDYVIKEDEVFTLTTINPLMENFKGGITCQFILERKDISLIVNFTNVIETMKLHEIIPFYSLLLYIFAARTSRRPCDMILNFGLLRCSPNKVPKIKEIISKTPKPFPVLKVFDYVKHKKLNELNYLDFVLCGY